MALNYALASIVTCVFLACSMPAFADGSRSSSERGDLESYNRACRIGNKAVELAKRGDYFGAVKLDREAIAINPRDAVWHHNLGNDLEKLGKLDEAIKEQQNAINLDPNMLAAWLAKGMEYELQRKFKSAEQCYRESVRISSKSYGALGCLGDILRKQGKFADAEKWLEEAKASPGAVYAPVGEIEKKLFQCRHKDSSD
ncbi:MAG: tetratricopeptide repeat protein [Candidatus Obscuribacterales bacterium]|nr:tetratricopeptide repeat protein [Candidatus Obscuribacterales bacterium]